MTAWLIYLAVGAMGAASVITQLALMREMLGAFAGNELALGIMLGNWLVLTGLGAWLGRKSDKLRHRETVLVAGLLLVALLPLVQLVVLRLLRDVVFLHGTTLGVGEVFAGSFGLVLPFCLVTGFLLTLACGLTSDIGGIYVADGIGSVAGGVVFSFVLIRYLDHFGVLCIPALLMLAVVGCYRQWRWVAAVVCLGVAGAWWGDVDAWSTARQYPGQRIVFRATSPYGRLVVTEAAGQCNFVENGLPVIATHNVEQVEETVHYAMAQRPTARRVLLIGGGVAGTTQEILKYPSAEVTYVELDPLIIAAGQRFLPAALARVRVINTDGRLFLKQTREKFDVVIVDLPEPVTAQLNRYYTAEFFAAVKRAMPADGVVAFAAGPYANFISRQLARLLASAHQTVRESFPNVLVIPGGRVFFVASAGELTLDIATRLEQAQIPTRFVQRHYLAGMLTPDRLADVQRALAAPAAVNRDYNPVLYFYYLQNWLSQFPVRFGLLEAAVLTALGIYLWRLRPVTLAIFAGGFAASALEIVLLLGVQIVCGALYRQLGVIVAAFMAGLAAGAWLVNRIRPRARVEIQRNSFSGTGVPPVDCVQTSGQTGETPVPLLSESTHPFGWHPELIACPESDRREGSQSFVEPEPKEILRDAQTDKLKNRRRLAGLACGVAVIAAVIPVVLRYAGNLPVIVAVTFGLAMVVGMEFPVASRADPAGGAATASRLYAADLVGACLGAWLASTLLIPLLGVPLVCVLTAGLNAVAGVVVWRRKI